MQKSLISVIVPVYNVEQYLPHCIESIRNQTYRNLEIILIDDGSTDHCPEICDDYARKDARIKVIHKENGGQATARNAGLDICGGEYISFVDSDDYIHPEFIRILYYILQKFHARVSMCGMKPTHSNIGNETYPQIRKFSVTRKNCLKQFTLWLPAPWNKLYKKELFETLRYPEVRCCEDIYTTYKAMFSAGIIAETTEKLYYYYQRKTSTMHQKNDFSDFVTEATLEFDEYCKANIKDTGLCREYLHHSHIVRLNRILDDYCLALRKGDQMRMEKNAHAYAVYKQKLLDDGFPLNRNYKIFDISPRLYTPAMKVYDFLYRYK